MGWFDALTDWASSSVNDFNRGLQIMGNGAQNLPGNFKRGVGVLRDTAAQDGTGAAISQFTNQAAQNVFNPETGYVPQAARGIASAPLTAGSIGLGAAKLGLNQLPDSAFYGKSQQTYGPDTPTATVLQDVFGASPDQAAKLAPVAEAPFYMAGTKLANSLGQGATSLADVITGGDTSPISKQITAVRGVGDLSQPQVEGNIPRTQASLQALDNHTQNFRNAMQDADGQGLTVQGYAHGPAPAEQTAGRQGGYIFTREAPGTAGEAGTFAHETAHEMVGTANRMGNANLLPMDLRGAAGLERLGGYGNDLLNEIVAHARGLSGESQALGHSSARQLINYIKGGLDYIMDPRMAENYATQHRANDPTGFSAGIHTFLGGQ